ncbi:putative oligopeptide ABC transporter, ATP-binding protein AppD [Clostridium sp. KLE 1755]|nr:putative oligopeptide ABC transporter, ATP-binding protein AppD [Clostridium sp. KLE 1755]
MESGVSQTPLLEIKGLKHYYDAGQRGVPAVDGVDLTLYPGEIVGIVGESGCGKSTVVRSLMGLIDSSSAKRIAGQAVFEGRDIFQMNEKELCKNRGKKIAMIFQNPLSALDPVYTVGDQIVEMILLHEAVSRAEAREKAMKLLSQVNIPSPEVRIDQYPHEMSGGMQQRIMIAIALACSPDILIADEPTTALDVTIQAQILALIKELRDKLGIAVILITHNMGVVAAVCDRMMVMYGGVVVEEGSCREIFAAPRHPYTKGLLAAIPSIEEDKEELYTIPGQVPVLEPPVESCRFVSRCQYAQKECLSAEPALIRENGHGCRCFRWQEVQKFQKEDAVLADE